jgi:hypothetical protein
VEEEEARTLPYWNDEAHPPLRRLDPILLRTQKKAPAESFLSRRSLVIHLNFAFGFRSNLSAPSYQRLTYQRLTYQREMVRLSRYTCVVPLAPIPSI